ncbi:uncharacterized protein LOC127802474 [Diospyros lotus]|uniref:uncharacterized protein LOC127802474 n=1 Tax=Diospyros lotus TaxID=55363 RepID=UPI00224DB3D4|nr:uncharacterized protein LOC127802474 [Diospyros lotus]
MGSKSNRSWKFILVMLSICFSRFAKAATMKYNGRDSASLDDFLQNYSSEKFPTPRTGVQYVVSLPANFTGMGASFVRVRAKTFWERGFNSSSFHIPPGILPLPFAKRFDLVFQNLGKLSSRYYNLPNFTLITPVLGLVVYDRTHLSQRGTSSLGFSVKGNPILVHFPRISPPEDRNLTMQCVRFGADETVELGNVTAANGCVARAHGHFAIVVPSPSPSPSPPRTAEERLLKWWVVAFLAGFLGLVVLLLVAAATCKFVKRKKIGKMERESEISEALGTMWIGRSKMPSATGMRTQPALEDDYVP